MAREVAVRLTPDDDGRPDDESGTVAKTNRQTALRYVAIRFPDNATRDRGDYLLMRKTRVLSLPNNEFVVPKAALKYLDDERIPYEVVRETSFDETIAALRDSAAPLL